MCFNSGADVTQQSSPFSKRKALPSLTQRYLPRISKEGVPDSFLSSSPPYPSPSKDAPEKPEWWLLYFLKPSPFAQAPQKGENRQRSQNKRKEETEQTGPTAARLTSSWALAVGTHPTSPFSESEPAGLRCVIIPLPWQSYGEPGAQGYNWTQSPRSEGSAANLRGTLCNPPAAPAMTSMRGRSEPPHQQGEEWVFPPPPPRLPFLLSASFLPSLPEF